MPYLSNLSRRKFIWGMSCTCGTSLVLHSCADVAMSERKQIKIFSDDYLYSKAFPAYKNFKSQAKLITGTSESKKIINIGLSIRDAINVYYANLGEEDPTANFQWEYILVDNKKVKNAWCMPGGKIAVYSGILEVTKNKHGLAAVMGHEIAHAVAKHSVERASRSMVINLGTQIADIVSGGKISGASRAAGVDIAGMLAHFGINNQFNRKQESEADYLGLIFSSLAGYDIRETTEIWKRMKETNKGKEPPEWMSTHPSSLRRIESLKNWIPEIIMKYPPIKKN